MSPNQYGIDEKYLLSLYTECPLYRLLYVLTMPVACCNTKIGPHLLFKNLNSSFQHKFQHVGTHRILLSKHDKVCYFDHH